MTSKYVVDASVLAEYVVAKSPYRERVTELLRRCERGEIELYLSSITLSELIYVTTRIYALAGLDKPNEEAMNYVSYLKGVGVRVVSPDGEVAVKAGELKKELRLSLADCYVLATSEKLGAVPVFKRLEKEMKSIESRLRKQGLKWLGELK